MDFKEATAFENDASLFIVETKLRHKLPSDRIPSRLSHAQIWALLKVKKEVIKTLLLLSTSSRAFIITQNGLQGFVQDYHDVHHSPSEWIADLTCSATFRNRMRDFVSDYSELE